MENDLCERCGYDPVDTDASIPDIWADRFQALCACCAGDGHRLQAKLEGE